MDTVTDSDLSVDDQTARLRKVAESLVGHLELRSLPHVPLSLAMVLDGGEPDGIHLDREGLTHLVSPFWNRVVELLDEGRGYRTVLRLFDRLRIKVAELDGVLEPASREQTALEIAIAAVEEEVESHGSHAVVASSIGPDSEPAGHGLWSWSRQDAGSEFVTLNAPGLSVVEDGPVFIVRDSECWNGSEKSRATSITSPFWSGGEKWLRSKRRSSSESSTPTS